MMLKSWRTLCNKQSLNGAHRGDDEHLAIEGLKSVRERREPRPIKFDRTVFTNHHCQNWFNKMLEILVCPFSRLSRTVRSSLISPHIALLIDSVCSPWNRMFSFVVEGFKQSLQFILRNSIPLPFSSSTTEIQVLRKRNLLGQDVFVSFHSLLEVLAQSPMACTMFHAQFMPLLNHY